jgi:hypothetical protein
VTIVNIGRYLESKPSYEITKYSIRPDLSKENVAFSGAPKKHPYDSGKILLISDPFSSNTIMYEFTISDITHVEELSHIVSEKGENLGIVRIWVKKGSLGLKYEPFVVADTLNFLKDTEVILDRDATDHDTTDHEVENGG